MSIQKTAAALWSKAPLWRGTLIAAAVCTVLVAFSNMQGQGGGIVKPPPIPPPPVPVPPVPPVINPGPDNIGRWTRFEIEVAAAKKEPREGVRCAQMADALKILEVSDLGFYQNDPAKQDKRIEAQTCQNRVEQSDRRLKALLDAHAAAEQDDSAQTVARLAAAYVVINTFDRSRAISPTQKGALTNGEQAEAEIKLSDKRIQALQASAQVAATDPSATNMDNLANAANAITGFDRARMSKLQLGMLERGQEAIDRVRESDARLSDLTSSLSIARSSADPGIRQTLIDAVAALTEFDKERATPAQQAAIAEARDQAAEYALDHLVRSAETFDPASSDPEPYERLKGLKILVMQYGDTVNASSEQKAALQQADVAIARLDESNRRLRALADAADAWERKPGPDVAPMMLAARDAITDLDRARMSPEQRGALKTVSNATSIIESSGKPGQDVLTYVTTKQDTEYKDIMVQSFRSELGAAGYALTSAREEAALIVEIDETAVDLSSVTIGTQTVDGATAALAMRATWAYDGSTFIRTTGRGRAANRSQDVAIEKAISQAAAALFKRFDQKVKEGKTQ